MKYGEPTRVTLTVNPVNDAPVAAANAYTVDEDATLTVPAAGVLGNDADVDGDALSAAVVSGPSHGTLTLNADGSFTYTPEANYYGTDSFTYRAVDPSGAESVATVSLTVSPVNDAPVAVDDAYTATEDAPFSAVVAGVTSLTMVSDPGDYIGQGQTYSFSPATGDVHRRAELRQRRVDQLQRGGRTSGGTWTSPPRTRGCSCRGSYTNAMRFPFQDPGRARAGRLRQRPRVEHPDRLVPGERGGLRPGRRGARLRRHLRAALRGDGPGAARRDPLQRRRRPPPAACSSTTPTPREVR